MPAVLAVQVGCLQLCIYRVCSRHIGRSMLNYCHVVLQLDLTERALLVGESCNCSEEHATVADRAAGLEKAKSGKLHESVSIKSFESSNSHGNGADKSRE